ncbi:hypothetical protein SEA_ZEINA_66 [Arthrobacter phage Zeina]|nr:hypothetical protein SEA_ZEINA_66 [Arthrobacter phage Zeina]
MDNTDVARLVGILMDRAGINEIHITREEVIQYDGYIESSFNRDTQICTLRRYHANPETTSVSNGNAT